MLQIYISFLSPIYRGILRELGEKVFTTIQYKNCYRIIKSSFDEVLNEFKEDVNGSNSKEE